MDSFDLSNAQKRTIITDINKPGSVTHVLSFKSRFELEDEEYVKNALKTLISGNMDLRLKKDEHLNIVQYYALPQEKPFSFRDLSTKNEDEINEFIRSFSQKPFLEIFDKPLYEFILIKTREELILAGRVHHILLDGTSVSILVNNMEQCVQSLKNGEKFPSPPASYHEYVEKEKEYLKSEKARKDEDFWLKNLEGYSQDWYSSSEEGIDNYAFYLTSELKDKLKNLSTIDGENISPFVLALTVVSLFFNKNNGPDMVWNSVYHGRDFGEDVKNMLGMFVNMMPLRLQYDKDRSFKQALLYTKKVLKNGLTHAKLSFNLYGPQLQKNGIDPAMLSMYSMVSNSTDAPLKYLLDNSESEFPFHIRVNPSLKDADGLQLLQIEYNTDCFSQKQIKQLVNGLEKLLEDIAEDPEELCENIPVETMSFYKAQEYFKDQLKKVDGATLIVGDKGGKKEEGSLKESFITLNKENMDEFCRIQNISPDTLFLGASLFSLVKLVFSKDILISVLSSNISPFNELPLVLNIDTSNTVGEYLKVIKEDLKVLGPYNDYPFTRISSKEFIEPEFVFGYGEVFTSYETPLALFVEEKEDDFKITVSYNDALYSKFLVDAFLESISTLLDIFMENINSPDIQLKDISISKITKKEEFKLNPVDEPLLNRLFEKRVDKNRDKIALIAHDGEFSYDQLNRMSNRVANSLLNKGVGLEDRILFMLKRDSRLIAAMLGIVKAGAAFIPVDPEYPQERIEQILEDSDAKYIITSSDLSNSSSLSSSSDLSVLHGIPDLSNFSDLSEGSVLDVNDLLLETDGENPPAEENPEPDLTPENLCYIIYTSGSTGKPKGVMLTHGGITNYVDPHPANLPIHALVNKTRKMISISTVSFIVFLREMFATMMNGVPVVLANEEQAVNPLELVKLFEKTGADAFGGTPTRLLQYLEMEEFQKTMPQCNIIIVGGELFPPQLHDIMSRYTDAEIYNSYGPTEITIASHGKLITSDDITAGDPLLNVTDSVMDIDGNPVPPGVVGELYVAGAGVARGYWKNEELTQKTFLHYNGLRYYNTGDLAKRDNRGELYVLGRMDNQVKLRGLRIELGEIENAITDYDGIRSVQVLLKNVQGNDHLCAYFIEDKKVDINHLKNALLHKLPAYMVPTYFLPMESFPLTPNGKTDTNSFPHPEEFDLQVEDIIPPETPLEKEIYAMCSEILETENFGVVTDLFQLGLTSLSVLKLVALISQKLGVQVKVTSVMKARNIREIAKEVATSDILEEKEYEIRDFYPLTQNQLGVYFDVVKNPEKLTYNLPKLMRFRKIDPEKLKNALIKTVDKHPYLKMRLSMHKGEVYQERRDDLAFDVEIQKGKVDDEVIHDFIQPFSLFEGPLFRFKIFTQGDETALLADFHHIMVDGTALNILFDDLGAIYDGVSSEKEKYNGFDFSLEELEVEKSKLYSQARDYFEKKVSEFDNATVISPDLKGKEKYGVLGEFGVSLDKSRIETYCKENSITPNNLFLAATVFTLSKFVYNKDILISTISNGRSNPNFQNTIAMLVKTLPLTLNINTNLNVQDFFNYVENIWLNVLKYEVYPFTQISNKYDIFPEFFYAYHGKIIEDININGQKVERESLEYEALKFKVGINVIDTGARFHILNQFNDALYSRDLMETFTRSIEVVINKLIQEPMALLKDISIVSDEGIPEDFRIKPVPEPMVNKIFENAVELNKNKIALISNDEELSFDELNRMANRIANSLIKRGVIAEDRVMFVLNRDNRLIATMLGIMKAGAAFIPVDPEYPRERIDYVLGDSNARYIISSEVSAEDLPNALSVDELLLEENEENPNPDISPENLCYLIYTSGSTGNPKGVMLTHGNISNYISPDPENVFAHAFVNKARKMLSITTVAFDVFIHETFITLMNGRTLVFANDEESKNPMELVKLFKKSGADAFSTTPSRMLNYLDVENICHVLSNCKIISVGGEPYSPQLHHKLKNCTGAEIYNIYGPTEITIACNTHLMTDAENITVGKTLLNVTELVMDMDGNPLPYGVIGELYVGGMGVARGYLNREELNKKQFITINGIPYYKTGDFASKEKNGEYKIYGRLDNQIKLRGLRIEIGEIENAIANYEGIESIAVVLRKVKGQDHLCAYFSSTHEIDIDDLKDELKKKLTKYMVPTIFMPMDKLPQTPNGKTDLKSLPEPVLKERVYVAPENTLEKFFTQAFSEILDVPQVGATDDFFELGGTSLLVTKITIEALNRGYEIKYGDVFAHPTPREMAHFISEAEKSEKDQEEYSYDVINAILDQNNIDNFIKGEKEDLGNVLLTGATGFLGIHVLKEFLENETGSIYCMLRKGRHTNPEDRLKTLLFYYFSESYEELFGSRIHVVEGDITSKADFEKCRGFSLDTVINCAANVKHFAAGTQIEDINIGGVVNGVEFCKKKDCKYIQVSTTSVAGESVDNVPPQDTIFDEQTLYVGQSLDNKYLSSKFTAERVVLEAVSQGLSAKIVRVGNLMARQSDSEFQINFETNGFINRLKAYAAIGKMPYSVLGGAIELTPIDLVSRAILLLGTTPKECVLFHAYNNHQIYIADMVEMMNEMGFDISGAEEEEFKEAFALAREDETKQDAISGLVTAIGMGKGEGRAMVKVVNNYSVQLLYRLGYKWPLISDEYLLTFIKYLKDMNFFDW